MKEWFKKNINYIAWSLFSVTTIISIYNWSKNGTDVTSVYRFFPLLGLLAFSTMWGHYVMWAIREYSGADAMKYKKYSQFSHWFVLLCIVLHPALIIIKLQSEGFGLPPASYESYVGKSMVGFVGLGMLCLLAFLSFEFKKFLEPRKQLWKGVLVLNHIAMLGIVIHAIRLGTDIRSTGLKYIWPFYGFTLLIFYIYLGSKKKLI